MIDPESLLSQELKTQLDIFLEAVEKDDEDLVIVLDGAEGAGKSKLARQLGYYAGYKLDKPFSVSCLFFDLEGYMKSCFADEHKKQRGKQYIMDESRKILNKKAGMSKPVRHFTDYISECRYLGGVHIICAPASHDLDKYITMWRMKLLIHVDKRFSQDKERWSGFKTERGHIRIYDPHDMISFFTNPQKMGYYKYPKKYIPSTFKNIEVLSDADLAAYNQAKYDAMKAKYHEADEDTPKSLSKDVINSIVEQCR